jgi:DNA-binding response OmpR family regulator
MTLPTTKPQRVSEVTSPLAHLVIVDDDPGLVEALEDMLASEGYRVEGFTDPATALVRLCQGLPTPDLVIADCIMPHVTGTELRAALAESGVDVPVLLMTALDPSFCVHPGDDVAILNKPFSLEDLLLEIEQRRLHSTSERLAQKAALA